MVAVCRKFSDDIYHPFLIIGMFQSVNMGKQVVIMAVVFLCTRSMGMLHLVMFRFKRVRQVSYLLFPYRFKNLIMGLEFIDADEPAPALTGLVVPDHHPVAEKFPADGGTVRIDYALKARAVAFPVHKNAPCFGGILSAGLQFLKSVSKFISIFRQHVNMEEFIGDSIPAKIIMVVDLTLNFYKIAKTHAASPTAIALELRHCKLHFMFLRIIKIWK
jgi:hypothetical protein